MKKHSTRSWTKLAFVGVYLCCESDSYRGVAGYRASIPMGASR